MKWIVVIAMVLATRVADASCSWSTISPVAFSYDPTSLLDTLGEGYFTYKCTVGTTITIDIDYGLKGTRTMVGTDMTNTDTLTYTLYQDITRLIAWGNTALTHATILSAATSFTQLKVYGKMAAKQNVKVGGYTDTLVVTINF